MVEILILGCFGEDTTMLKPVTPTYWEQLQDFLAGFLNSLIAPNSLLCKYEQIAPKVEVLKAIYRRGENPSEEEHKRRLQKEILELLGEDSPFNVRAVDGTSLMENALNSPKLLLFLLTQHENRGSVPTGPVVFSTSERLFRSLSERYWGQPNIDMLGVKGSTLAYLAAHAVAFDMTKEESRQPYRDSLLLLLETGARMDVSSRRTGQTPLHLLAGSEQDETGIMLSLLYSMKDVSSSARWVPFTTMNSDRQTPLSLAVLAGRKDFIAAMFTLLKDDEAALVALLSPVIKHPRSPRFKEVRCSVSKLLLAEATQLELSEEHQRLVAIIDQKIGKQNYTVHSFSTGDVAGLDGYHGNVAFVPGYRARTTSERDLGTSVDLAAQEEGRPRVNSALRH